jgi:conjugative relaxase-like TrwC/TraI family protein
MLTIANITVAQGSSYYKQENYYSQDAAAAQSEWRGIGAASLELSGVITNGEVFENVVKGLSPDGSMDLRQHLQREGDQERAGYDLTFSAPKSVSLACLVGGDKRLEEAHRNAVRNVLDLIESRYAITRVKRQRVQSGNLVMALWHHDTTRELDPHLHTHCLIMNATQNGDGQWQTVSNEGFYYNKMLLGRMYRQELALECQRLGYDIETHPQELFEINGYRREQIMAFSKRHEQIEEYLTGKELDITTESKVWAWRRTRVKKNHAVDRQELAAFWQAEAELYGIVHPQSKQGTEPQTSESTVQNGFVDQYDPSPLSRAVEAAIAHCSERQVAFRIEAIEKFIASEYQPFSLLAIQPALERHPDILKTYDGRYTTEAALQRELATIRVMRSGKGYCRAIANAQTIDRYLYNQSLRAGQRNAIVQSATTTDQFIAWQGVAGAGKTYTLNAFREIAEAQGYGVRGFAPSAEAAKVLGDEVGIEAETVAKLLVSPLAEHPVPNQVWIVDEAGLMSAKDALALLVRAQAETARVILVGDTQQLSPVAAGNPFLSLQQAGIQTVHLTESLRQQTPGLKKAVQLASSGRVGDALMQLQALGHLEEVKGSGDRAKKMAVDYLALTPVQRQQTLMVAGTHAERREIIAQVRAGLKAEGSLGTGTQATQLRPKDLTQVQSCYSHNYQVGDVIIPTREYPAQGLSKFKPYTVTVIDGDQLWVIDSRGYENRVNPMTFRKTVYIPDTIAIAVGEQLRWTCNDRALGRRNGQGFTVTELDGTMAAIAYSNGETDTLNLLEALHLDYALVSTTYAAQGKTAERVLIAAGEYGVSQESLYVAISRAKQDIHIYAESLEQLLEQAQQSSAKENPLALLTAPMQRQQVLHQPEETIHHTGIQQLSERMDEQRPVPETSEPQPKPIKRTQPAVFWQPQYPESPPHGIEEAHWQEFKRSAIHPSLIQLNAESIAGQVVYERLLSEKLAGMGSGQYVTVPMARAMQRYEQVAEGGWWGKAGIDAQSLVDLAPGQQPTLSLWGCFKPDHPRIDASKSERKGETVFIKYEHPAQTERHLYLPLMPDELAERIYAKYGVTAKQRGYWSIIKDNPEIPINITEGFKKTLAATSQGEVTIGISGVNGLYRANDGDGNRLRDRQLNPEIEIFAQPGRVFRFSFDQDSNPATIRNVRRDMVRAIELLEDRGCICQVVKWDGQLGKGLDDLIFNKSPQVYTQAIQTAESSDWEKQIHYRTQYNAIARQLAKAENLSQQALDVAVYQIAIVTGDRRDGERFLLQSDHARSLSDPMHIQQYIAEISAIAQPPFRLEVSHEDTQPCALMQAERETIAQAALEWAQSLGQPNEKGEWIWKGTVFEFAGDPVQQSVTIRLLAEDRDVIQMRGGQVVKLPFKHEDWQRLRNLPHDTRKMLKQQDVNQRAMDNPAHRLNTNQTHHRGRRL